MDREFIMTEGDYILKNPNNTADFGFLRQLAGSGSKYVLGYIKHKQGHEVPALWTEDGQCHLVGAATNWNVCKDYNLVFRSERSSG